MKIKLSMALLIGLAASASAEGNWNEPSTDRFSERAAMRQPTQALQESLDVDAPEGMVSMPVGGSAQAKPAPWRPAQRLVGLPHLTAEGQGRVAYYADNAQPARAGRRVRLDGARAAQALAQNALAALNVAVNVNVRVQVRGSGSLRAFGR